MTKSSLFPTLVVVAATLTGCAHKKPTLNDATFEQAHRATTLQPGPRARIETGKLIAQPGDRSSSLLFLKLQALEGTEWLSTYAGNVVNQARFVPIVVLEKLQYVTTKLMSRRHQMTEITAVPAKPTNGHPLLATSSEERVSEVTDPSRTITVANAQSGQASRMSLTK